MKLTSEVNFTNAPLTAFTLLDPKNVKNTDNLTGFLCFGVQKLHVNMLMNSTIEVNFTMPLAQSPNALMQRVWYNPENKARSYAQLLLFTLYAGCTQKDHYKSTGRKAACRMLMVLTAAINFINIFVQKFVQSQTLRIEKTFVQKMLT